MNYDTQRLNDALDAAHRRIRELKAELEQQAHEHRVLLTQTQVTHDVAVAKLQRSIDLICDMAAQLTDPTALELIQDILHPEERHV